MKTRKLERVLIPPRPHMVGDGFRVHQYIPSALGAGFERMDPFIWYNDIDGTRSDMGATGGLYATPNFTSHDFGSVGDFGSSLDFSLFNYRQSSIVISEVNFNTSSFTTNSSFPITIDSWGAIIKDVFVPSSL